MLFWNSCAYSVIQRLLAIWSLIPLPFLNLAGIFERSWTLAWRILSMSYLYVKWTQFCSSLNILWHYYPSLGLKWEHLFQSSGHCWVLQICCHIECSPLTASSFRIWNRSAGIPSPPLALFIVMLPKVYLTSHCTMSGSRWVFTASWLSGSWRSFLYSSSVYIILFWIIFVYMYLKCICSEWMGKRLNK